MALTEFLAHELYLDKKYHEDHNNTPEIICNDCINKQWELSTREKKKMTKNALEIAKKKYDL